MCYAAAGSAIPLAHTNERCVAMARTKDKIQPCGHGSRHISPYDGRCRRCVKAALAEGIKRDWDTFPAPVAGKTKAIRHEHDEVVDAAA